METSARDRQRLLELLTERSFERRKVVLSSGRESDFYIDCKRTALLAEGHYLIGRQLLDAVRRDAPEAVAVGGLDLGPALLVGLAVDRAALGVPDQHVRAAELGQHLPGDVAGVGAGIVLRDILRPVCEPQLVTVDQGLHAA